MGNVTAVVIKHDRPEMCRCPTGITEHMYRRLLHRIPTSALTEATLQHLGGEVRDKQSHKLKYCNENVEESLGGSNKQPPDLQRVARRTQAPQSTRSAPFLTQALFCHPDAFSDQRWDEASPFPVSSTFQHKGGAPHADPHDMHLNKLDAPHDSLPANLLAAPGESRSSASACLMIRHHLRTLRFVGLHL